MYNVSIIDEILSNSEHSLNLKHWYNVITKGKANPIPEKLFCKFDQRHEPAGDQHQMKF